MIGSSKELLLVALVPFRFHKVRSLIDFAAPLLSFSINVSSLWMSLLTFALLYGASRSIPALSAQIALKRSSNFSLAITPDALLSMSLTSSSPPASTSNAAIRIASDAIISVNSLASPYTDASYFYNVPFGSHSHWLQPWRAYAETMPATTFVNGIGVGLDLNHKENPDLVLQMLARHGIQNVRIEIGWSSLDYYTEILTNDRLQLILNACKRWGVRPLILLNAHQGVPTPIQFFERTLLANALVGSRKIQLSDTSNLVVGKSGLNGLTEYWAAEALITAINGNTVTLSKPLPKTIKRGTSVSMATLKYRPFSKPGSVDYRETITSWNHYVGTVAKFVSNALGTTQISDKGFDMEIWNELTFGSQFLSINNYYNPDLSKYDEESIWHNLVKTTTDYAVANPRQFLGVQFSDGFANTTPWPASSEEPARIDAISKHPYVGRKNFPQDEQNGLKIDALGQTTDFIPAYSTLFPEYYATALQTETLLRDAGPLTNEIYGTRHGRYARQVNGQVVPTDVWITEVGIAPNEESIKDLSKALTLKAKTALRYYTFYLNKGVTKLYLYSAASGDLGLGIVQDNFLQYSRTNSTYPANARHYVSPALQATGRIVAKMKQDLDPSLVQTRQLHVDSISDTHNHFQFMGDRTTTHPNLYNRDVFAFLPYQVNKSRFVIPYYVMTRDVTKDLPPENFTIQISKLKAQGATIGAYDPINDCSVPVRTNHQGNDFIKVTLPTTDYPYLLIIQEQ